MKPKGEVHPAAEHTILTSKERYGHASGTCFFTCIILLECCNSSMRRYNQLHHMDEETEAQGVYLSSSRTARAKHRKH